jgi:hypothetical protein
MSASPQRSTDALAWLALAGAPLVYAIAAAPAGSRALPYIALHLALSLAQLALSRRVSREDNTNTTILTVSIFARVALIAAPPFTTTDVARYLWDGAVVLARRDPYALAPGDPSLTSLAARWPLPADHHDVVTCYPPLAEALFALCSAAGPRAAPFLWKSLVALASALSARSLWRASLDAPARAAALLWMLHPLVLFEGGVGAHLDVLSASFVLWAVLSAERSRWARAGLALGVAVSLKLTPAVVCVALWPRAKPRWSWPLWCALVPSATILLPWSMGLALPGSLPLVARHWSFGAPLWSALYARFSTHDDVIRPALSALGAALVFAQWLRPKASHAAVARDALLGYALTSPTLYPWYLTPVLACAARAPSALAWALATVTPLTYEVIDRYQSHRQWNPARWPLALTAIVALVAFALDVVRARRAQRSP